MKNGISINMTKVIDNFPALIILLNCSHKIVFANAKANKLFGQKDIAGDFCYKIFNNYDEPCNVPVSECYVRSFFETGDFLNITCKCISLYNKGISLISFDAGGGIVGITCRNLLNESLDYQKIIHTGKMAALGSMLAHIVHNLNSSLYVTGNYINTLQKKLKENIKPEEITEYIDKISSTNKLSSNMTKTLLDYTKHKESENKIYAKEAIDEIISIFCTALDSHGIKLIMTGEEVGPAVNRQKLLTTVFCIIQNAIDAMPEGGTLSIDISNSTISIKDTGKGMSGDIQQKLFTPYFSTKPSGTGLGLYIAKNMMNTMNGRLEIFSSEGKGTELKLVFQGEK